MQGNVVDAGSTSFSFNRAGYVLHSAVHSARPDVRCVIHIHHPPVVAVSSITFLGRFRKYYLSEHFFIYQHGTN